MGHDVGADLTGFDQGQGGQVFERGIGQCAQRRMTRCPDQFTCGEVDQVIYQTIADQRGGKCSPPFAKNTGEAKRRQSGKGIG